MAFGRAPGGGVCSAACRLGVALRGFVSAAFVSTTFLPLTVLADSGPGDDPGAVLAMSCSGCHGAAPAGADGIPSLAELSADEIAGKLRAYRSGEAQGTLMNRLARGYTKDEIRQIAEALGATAQ